MRHAPSCCGPEFLGGWFKRAKILDVIAASVNRGVQLEMNVVQTVDIECL